MILSETEINERIDASDQAKKAIGDLATELEKVLRSVDQPRRNDLKGQARDGLERAVTQAVTTYFSDIVHWTADRWGHADYVPKEGEESFPPSQMVIKVIKELEFFAEFFAAPQRAKRIRGRKFISRYAIDALLKQGLIGDWLLSIALASDFDPDLNCRVDALGLGGRDEPILIGDDLSYGFLNPSAFTRHGEINTRLLKRMMIMARYDGGTGFVRSDRVRWALSEEVQKALAAVPDEIGRVSGASPLFLGRLLDGSVFGSHSRAPAASRRSQAAQKKWLWRLFDSVKSHYSRKLSQSEERHLAVAKVQARLSDLGRANLSFCCRQAARLLEMNLHIAERFGSNVLSGESISSFLHTSALHRFMVRLFTLGAPTTEWQDLLKADGPRFLEDISITCPDMIRNEADGLGPKLKVFVCKGLECADRVGAAIDFDEMNLNVDAGLLGLTGDIEKNLKDSREVDGAADDLKHRLNGGRKRLVNRLWVLRQGGLIIRAYYIFLEWYLDRLREHGFKEPNERFVALLMQCFALKDWAFELRARFESGVAYPRDVKRRADGAPLPIYEIPFSVTVCHVELIDYPGMFELGALPDPRIIEDLWEAISDDFPEAREVWRNACSVLNPYSGIPKKTP